MFTTFFRIIKYGILNFLRNGWLSCATIMMIVLALFVFQGLMVFNILSRGTIKVLEDRIDISVYFKSPVVEDEILEIKSNLEELPEVKRVEYISREEALEEFKFRHQEEEIVMQALEELEENPLLASLNIKAYDPREYANIALYLEKEAPQASVEKVTFAQNQIIIERLISITDTIGKGGMILTIILAFLALVVAFNTIRLAIYSNRKQIEIMRLVGASNSFISGPFLIEGILYGILAGILSFSVFIPLALLASPYVSSFIPEINFQNYLKANFLNLLFYQMIFGVMLGVSSSFLAIRRYLRS